MTSRKIIYSIFVLIFIGLFIYTYILYFGSSKEKKNLISDVVPEVVTEASGDTNEEIAVEIIKTEGGQLANKNIIAIPVPNLNRAIQIPVSTPPAQKEEITNNINTLIALLKTDPQLFNEWLGLGLFRKFIEDYEGAREAWEYASILRPKNSLSFSNLAMLYGYYLKNPVLAEKNYLKAIENDSKLPYLYAQAADFYIEVLNQPEKAREILQKGLQMIPGDDGLESALDSLE